MSAVSVLESKPTALTLQDCACPNPTQATVSTISGGEGAKNHDECDCACPAAVKATTEPVLAVGDASQGIVFNDCACPPAVKAITEGTGVATVASGTTIEVTVTVPAV